MMNSFQRKIIENRKVTLFFIAALAVLGIYNYWIMPKQENPQVTPPVARVSVIYPGASPEEVRESVTIKIEDELAGIEGLDYLESYSQNSVSSVIIWLQNDTDVAQAWEDLRQKMDDLQSSLPEDSQRIQIDTEMDKTAGFILSFSGEGYSRQQLSFYAEKVKKEIENVRGIAKLEIN